MARLPLCFAILYSEILTHLIVTIKADTVGLGPFSKRQLELNSEYNSKAELRVQLKFKGKMVF